MDSMMAEDLVSPIITQLPFCLLHVSSPFLLTPPMLIICVWSAPLLFSRSQLVVLWVKCHDLG